MKNEKESDITPDYTLREVAYILNCDMRVVRVLVETGRLKAYRLQRVLRITPESLAEFRTRNV